MRKLFLENQKTAVIRGKGITAVSNGDELEFNGLAHVNGIRT
jgi:hypothetical protein